MLTCIIMTVIGFFSGSVMYSYLIPKILRKVDVRASSEDGNPGSMNAITESGVVMGIVCLILDVLKAAVPVFIAVSIIRVYGFYLIPIIAAPVLGHGFSPFLKFRGGKAVAASFGSLLGAFGISNALIVLVIITVTFQFILVIKPNSTKVVTAFVLATIAIFLVEPLWEIIFAMVIISLVVCVKNLLNPNAGELRASIGSFEIALCNVENRIKLRRKT